MNISNISKFVKPVANFAKKSAPYVKTYGAKALKFISKHRVGIGLTAVAGGLAVDDFRVRKSLEQEREKNVLYQEALKKHQAEIDTLKTDIEREEYKNRLWKELMSKMEG